MPSFGKTKSQIMSNPIQNANLFDDDKNLSKSQPNIASLRRQVSSEFENTLKKDQFPAELIDSAM